jgi:citrate synthase
LNATLPRPNIDVNLDAIDQHKMRAETTAAMQWLTAEQALKFLGVRAQTLYANVSRGKIRAKPDPGDSRRSLYNGRDIARLADRRGGRRSAGAIAAQAIGWGDPILVSAVSTVADGRLWYRGRDAIALAEGATLEDIAGLLWQAETARAPGAARTPKSGRPAVGNTPLKRLLVAIAERTATDPPLLGRSPAILRAEAQILFDTVLAAALGGIGARAASPAHARLAAAWRRPGAKDILRRTLVLLADHELNASTFAVRVAASTGASLPACLLAGLATLSGPLHGGAARALQALLDAARRRGAHEAVREWLARGELLPAFGHPLYPQGDPRAIALLRHIKLSGIFAQVRAVAEDLTGERPNVDFALAALAEAHALPREAPFVVFALSRSVGWIAHALEQTATGQLIRPRARYVGPAIAKGTANGPPR